MEYYIIKYYRNKYCNEKMSIIMSNGKTNYLIAVITPQYNYTYNYICTCDDMYLHMQRKSIKG